METNLQNILGQFRDDARNNRDLGDRFERLIQQYLQIDPLYAGQFSNVWLWNQWPDKPNFGDIGIDLVAQEKATGNLWGIQCKFYLPEHTVSKGDIDKFLAALGNKPFTNGMIISTTDHWGKNAFGALDQSKQVVRLGINDLEKAPIDWSRFDSRKPGLLTRTDKKTIRPHQSQALEDVIGGFETADRGKLIMACGTGKTFTSLKIAEKLKEKLAGKKRPAKVLFLVPSLSLMAQTLREWMDQTDLEIAPMAVCSDPSIGKRRVKRGSDSPEITLYDLPFPATTNSQELTTQYNSICAKQNSAKAQMMAVFSTYQSIDAVSKAQKAGLGEFDLIICDEAHRTTGVTLKGEDESTFVKVHDNNFLSAKKRLYMTATPRLYDSNTKSKAQAASAVLCSMDDETMFGAELHRLGFGEAVSKDLLSDYKVLVLAVDEKYVSGEFQSQLSDDNNELNLEDAAKITGCWNGLEKRFEALQTPEDFQGDDQPMRRAVAFSRSIKSSKQFVDQSLQLVLAYCEKHPKRNPLRIEAEHVDGTFDALQRNALLDWLKSESPDNTCRILSNARCLSEGVDVPALDSVIFLNPRNSQVDVVQSVGRVMRKAEGKRFGYIILPIGVPADQKPEEALNDNKKYKVVWDILQALRAHDDRFNATINRVELNEKRPDQIQVIGVGGGPGDYGDEQSGANKDTNNDTAPARTIQNTFKFPHIDEWKTAFYAKMVMKVGERGYWQAWAQDIAAIAQRHVTRIKALLEEPQSESAKTFTKFLKGLRTNLNPEVREDEAIEMLAQHQITKPIFDALFSNYAFTKENPVSRDMQKMLDILQDQAIDKERQTLDKFYASVAERAKGIDNLKGRQRVITELYEEFFKNAFPRMTQRLGIVYTPVEVVDFIINSAEDILRDEFNSGLGEKDVHIIDPFTGTGTFIVRLLQSGLIAPKDLQRKYKKELHANEIVLLAYYIAAINIEEAYHSLTENEKTNAQYEPFDGIVLTDTFQLYESKGALADYTFPENHSRVKRQKESPIRVVIANPPYSSGQTSSNDNNPNLSYPSLDARIRQSYAAHTNARNKNGLYDSYIRAIRWASDRIADKGVVGFVTNGSFIDSNAADGLRSCLTDEFTSIYVFNLRGNQRTSGDISKREGGKIFGSGSRAPIAITLLIKNPDKPNKCQLHYHDIGDYLNRKDKLKIISNFGSINGIENEKQWQLIKPNAEHDWINQRDPGFDKFIPLVDINRVSQERYFSNYSMGISTSRDAWTINFSNIALWKNMQKTIDFYNTQVDKFENLFGHLLNKERAAKLNDFIETNSKKIGWSHSLKNDLKNLHRISPSKKKIVECMYRPYMRGLLYFDNHMIHRTSNIRKLFPNGDTDNLVICTDSKGSTKDFSTLILNVIPDYHIFASCQCFPLYLYEPAEKNGQSTFDDGEIIDGYRKRDAITDAILKKFKSTYDDKVSKEDIFYYVYGILHSPEYRQRFTADLKKMLPRIPLTKKADDFWKFSKAGRDLAQLHLNYETVEKWPVAEYRTGLIDDDWDVFKVQKMNFARPTAEQKKAGQKWDKTQIIYNQHLTIAQIPLRAYEYIVNGKPALEWIMERYQVTRDKKSDIVNNPNDWCKEHNNPRYIADLIASVTRVSMETLDIVENLPALNEQ